jgi:Ubiquitin-2 like Rad60 SUMO-like
MAELLEAITADNSQVEGVETTSKTAQSADKATLDWSASEMSPSSQTEPSPEDCKNENEVPRNKVTETVSQEKESTNKVVKGDTATDKLSAEALPLDDPKEKEQNGDNKCSDAEPKEQDAKNEEDSNNKHKHQDLAAGPVVSTTKRTRPPYKYDPKKVTLRFLFANKDGLTVTVECRPGDTVGEVKGQLLSAWPKGKQTMRLRYLLRSHVGTDFFIWCFSPDLPDCSGGDQLRLICMGKGMLMPDSRTLEDCQVPVFKSHPTPVNVSVRPKTIGTETTKTSKDSGICGSSTPGTGPGRTSEETGQGCSCAIQ